MLSDDDGAAGGQLCHAEGTKHLDAGATDPSLRLRVTVEGPISKSVLFFETA